MAGKPHAESPRSSSAPSAKLLIEQAEQPIEGRLVAAVRRGGQQDQVALRVLGKTLEQLEPLLPALVRADAGMRFVDHDQRPGRSAQSCRGAARP